jgi:hypothetical protein
MKFSEAWNPNPTKPEGGLYKTPHHDALVRLGTKYSAAQSSGSNAGYIANEPIDPMVVHKWATSNGFTPGSGGDRWMSYRGKGGPYADEKLMVHKADDGKISMIHHSYTVDRT